YVVSYSDYDWAVGRRVIFFFQAEDGIRDFHVTGVQTCALPIFLREALQRVGGREDHHVGDLGAGDVRDPPAATLGEHEGVRRGRCHHDPLHHPSRMRGRRRLPDPSRGRIQSVRIAPSSTAPVTTPCQKPEMPAIVSPLDRMPRNSTPSTVPRIPPSPPRKDVPPRRTAAAACRAIPAPIVGPADWIRAAMTSPASTAHPVHSR